MITPFQGTTSRALASAFAVLLALGATAQTVTEDFKDSTAPGWTFGGTTTPVLTSGGVDPAGDGWLRLTPLAGNQATYAYYNTALDAANRSFYGSFDFAIWNQGGIGAADGIVFYLYDGSKPFAQGADGGSIGYAQKTGVDGKPGGYMGLAIDNWGNYSNPTEGRIGGPGFIPNAIAVRGPGDGLLGYEYIAGTGDGTNPALSTNLDFPGSTSRPTADADYRHLEFTLSSTGQLTVLLQSGTTGDLEVVLTADLSGYTRPDTLGFGYAAGTGSAYSYHEVRNFSLTSLVANLWDNTAGTGLWGTALNWNPDAVPISGADILFDNTFISTAQAVDLGAVTRTVHGLTFDAPVAYTLSNGTVNFDNGGGATPATLNATQINGNANHVINANVTAASDLTVSNNMDTANSLTVNGTLDNNGHAILVTGSGNTILNGVVSDTGTLTKTGTGTLELNGNNTYSGGTTLSVGTISVGHNNGLGTGTLTINGGTLQAGGGSRNVGNAATLQGNVTIGGSNALTFGGQWTQTGGDRTITLSNSALTTYSGNIVLAENNQTRTLTMDVGSGGAVVNGVISDGTGTGADGFTKNGTGELTFGGANTYTGTTTINAGILGISASNRISDSSAMNINGGTFDLNGTYSERVNTLSYNNGTIDYGPAGTANYFLFGAAGTQAGNLTINNWESGTDVLAILSAAPAPSAAFLDNIYFSGVGSGAVLGAPNQTVGSYGSIWTPLTPAAQPTYTWDGGGGNNNWSTGNNWVGNIAPPLAVNTTRLIFTGNTRLTPNMQNSYTVNSVKFDSAAGAFTLNPNNRTLTMGGVLPSIIQQSANNQIINSPIVMNPTSGGAMVVDVSGAGTLTLNGVISQTPAGTGIIKVGGSTLILTGANTFTGAVSIDEGIVNIRNATALGTTAGGVTVAQGAALQIQNGIAVGAEALTLNGSGVSGTGALRNISGNNSWSGAVTLGSATRINSDANTLTMSGGISGTQNLTVGGAGNVTLSGAITTGTGTLTKDGAGTLTLSGGGANTFTGDVAINAGTLDLNKTAGVNAIAGNVTVGDGTGTDTLRLLASNQIADTSVMTMNSSGVFNLNNFNETISGLNSVYSSSSVTLGTGTLTINSFENSTFSGVVSGGGNLVKQGANTFTMTGANTYTGTTTISAGVLNIQNAAALGTTAGGTTVSASGAALELQGGIAVGTEGLTLNGDGVSSHGALRNVSGNNSWAGNVTLGSASRINSDLGTLTISGGISGAQNLTVGGDGNTVLSGVIGTGAGTFTKDGTGTVQLTGGAANTFTGATTVNGGTLELAKTGALGSTSSVTVNTGGTLLFTGASTDRINNAAGITMAGGTLTSMDATESMGVLTLAGDSVINLGTDGNVDTLTFANFVNTSGTLTINNWQGDPFSSGTDDRIFLTGVAPGTIFANISFTGFGVGAYVLPSREICPMPEPGTYAAGALVILLLGWHWLRRRAALRRA